MDTSNEMLQDERNHVTSSSGSLHAQDRSIRRLKWAVAFCFVLLSALVLITVFLLQSGFPDDRDKVQMNRHLGTNPDTDTRPKDHLTGTNPDTDTRPKAHLTGTRQNDASAEDLHWESRRGLAFLKNGMKYSNKSIIIPKEGYYFVYSKLSFRPPDSACLDDKPVSQSIMRSNSNYPEPETILSGISFCTKGSKIYQPIYLGGLLHLKRGDELKVNVKPVTPIDSSVDHKTYFGAFLV